MAWGRWGQSRSVRVPGAGRWGTSSNLRYPLLNGLAAYWANNDLTGVDTLGASNLSKSGTGTSLVSGKVHPNAVQFPAVGVADYFSVASNERLTSNANGFTLATWVNLVDALAGNQGFISKFGAEYYLYRPGGAPNATWLIQKADGSNVLTDAGAVTKDVWRLIVCGWNPVGNAFAYNNNTVIATPACPTAKIDTGAFSLGRNGSLSGMRLGPVMKWNRVLTADERTQLWNGGMGLGYPFNVPSHVIVFDGDSLTWGGGEAQYPRPYPYQTITSLGGSYTWHNTGVAGRSFAAIIAAAAAEVDTKIVAGKKNILLVCGGTNDLYPNGTSGTAASVEANVQTYVAARKAAGWNKVLATTLTAMDPVGVDPDCEAQRLIYNQWLRDNYATFADGLVDPGGDATIGDVANCGNATFFTDRLHLTTAGFAIWAGLAKTALLAA
jgi:lysophospholipase L1-like esterase